MVDTRKLQQDLTSNLDMLKYTVKEVEEQNKKGNRAFKNEDYKQAVIEYTGCIEKIKDTPKYYANRAHAYIYLGVPNEAIRDCHSAFELETKERSLPWRLKTKLYVRLAMALRKNIHVDKNEK